MIRKQLPCIIRLSLWEREHVNTEIIRQTILEQKWSLYWINLALEPKTNTRKHLTAASLFLFTAERWTLLQSQTRPANQPVRTPVLDDLLNGLWSHLFLLLCALRPRHNCLGNCKSIEKPPGVGEATLRRQAPTHSQPATWEAIMLRIHSTWLHFQQLGPALRACACAVEGSPWTRQAPHLV